MNVLSTIFQLLGSLGFLLYGMKMMSDGIQKSAGKSTGKSTEKKQVIHARAHSKEIEIENNINNKKKKDRIYISAI